MYFEQGMRVEITDGVMRGKVGTVEGQEGGLWLVRLDDLPSYSYPVVPDEVIVARPEAA